jgi:hypothetical protein
VKVLGKVEGEKWLRWSLGKKYSLMKALFWKPFMGRSPARTAIKGSSLLIKIQPIRI